MDYLDLRRSEFDRPREDSSEPGIAVSSPRALGCTSGQFAMQHPQSVNPASTEGFRRSVGPSHRQLVSLSGISRTTSVNEVRAEIDRLLGRYPLDHVPGPG